MKFELKSYNHNILDKEILKDIESVANKLNVMTISRTAYNTCGKYHPSTIVRRFGSWNEALKAAKLDTTWTPKIEGTAILEDLKKVAKIIDKNTVSKLDYESHGKYSYDVVHRRFGSWNAALLQAGLKKSTNKNTTIDELLENLEEVWVRIGKQPSVKDMVTPLSKYSANTYSRRFGSWRNALKSFIEYADTSIPKTSDERRAIGDFTPTTETIIEYPKHKTKRDPNWRMRFIVMKRDNFKCQSCGRSPATDPSVILHVDHKKAWANGGETVIDNLQTLCSVCNIGKSSL